MATYAQINPNTNQLVTDANGNPVFLDIDPAFIAAAKAAGNPKGSAYLPVNMTAQPTTDPSTGQPIDPSKQAVVQNGWTVNTTNEDVEPVWQVVALTADQQTAYQQAQYAKAQLVTSDLQTAVNNWATLTAAQKDAVLKRVTQIAIAVIRRLGGS
jgi:hypothetical protein